MAEYTLGWISEKISEIDDLIFRADTGQITLTAPQYESLQEDAKSLMNTLAEDMAHRSGKSAAEMYEEREKVRRAIRLAATATRYTELHPEEDPEVDAIFKAMSSDDVEVAAIAQRRVAELWASIFVNKCNEQALPPPLPPMTLRQRIFRR